MHELKTCKKAGRLRSVEPVLLLRALLSVGGLRHLSLNEDPQAVIRMRFARLLQARQNVITTPKGSASPMYNRCNIVLASRLSSCGQMFMQVALSQSIGFGTVHAGNARKNRVCGHSII